MALHSPGGSVSAALALGRLLRGREIATEVPAGAACLSACPFAFAGGVTRTVSPDGWLGVHQSYFDQSAIMPAFVAVERIQLGEAQVLRYLHAMGIDPMVMVHALETPSDQIYLLSAAELDRYGLVTDGATSPPASRSHGGAAAPQPQKTRLTLPSGDSVMVSRFGS